MSNDFDWIGILGMLAILGAMFVVPIVIFSRDWQAQKKAEREQADQDAADEVQEPVTR